MINFILATAALLAIVVVAGWHWIKPWLMSKLRVQMLTFSAPRPDAKAGVLTFTGLEIGNNFIGHVTMQAATQAPPEPAPSRIVMP